MKNIWLREDYTVITNEAGDKVFLSKDGPRKIRLQDFNNPYAQQSSCAYIEEYINGE